MSRLKSLALGTTLAISILALGAVSAIAELRTSADGNVQEGFVTLANQQKLYVRHNVAKAGEPTLVVLNGLTYKFESWDKMMPGLMNQGYGILRYDMRGQGRTLTEYAPLKEKIVIETQAEDLKLLLDELGITGRVHLMGLSYGGGVGPIFASRYPERVASLILMAPFTEPLKGLDDQVKQKVKMHRFMHPGDKATDDELYEKYLKDLIYQTFPIYEPVVRENPHGLEGAFRLTSGARFYNVAEILNKLPAGTVHLMIAGRDQYIDRSIHDRFWKNLAPAQKMSRIVIDGSEHKIPEAVPAFAAGWVNLIIKGDSRLSGGKAFTGTPRLGQAKGDGAVIELPKEGGSGFGGGTTDGGSTFPWPFPRR